MAYDVEVVSLNVTSADVATINVSWRIKNNDTETLKVYSDVHFNGNNVNSYSETLGPGDTYDYWKKYEGTPTGDVEVCVEATGAPEYIL